MIVPGDQSLLQAAPLGSCPLPEGPRLSDVEVQVLVGMLGGARALLLPAELLPSSARVLAASPTQQPPPSPSGAAPPSWHRNMPRILLQQPLQPAGTSLCSRWPACLPEAPQAQRRGQPLPRARGHQCWQQQQLSPSPWEGFPSKPAALWSAGPFETSLWVNCTDAGAHSVLE